MMYHPNIHHRQSIRLKDYDYSEAGAYFVTVCAWKKEYLFGEIKNGEMMLNECGETVAKWWEAIPDHFHHVELDEFVIMPNHVHGIIVLNVGAIETRKHRRQMLLPKIIGRLKMNSAKHINIIRTTPGVPVWQRNYYEHVIRDEPELHTIREYIRQNPLKWDIDEENPESSPEDSK